MEKFSPTPLTKEQYAYNNLRKAIIHCELAPGEKLIIDRISEESGLSQIPIRAAIQRLQTEGLVIINPHSSAIVSPIPKEKINEVFVLLEGLEQIAFSVAAKNRTDADLTDLIDLHHQMDEKSTNNKPIKWLELNCAFHRKIAAISGMPMLTDFTIRVLDEWERIGHCFFMDITNNRLPIAQAEHRQIIEFLKTRDTKSLQNIAITHNRAASLSYQALLQ